jgi:hypothetical protein
MLGEGRHGSRTQRAKKTKVTRGGSDQPDIDRKKQPDKTAHRLKHGTFAVCVRNDGYETCSS